MTLLGLRPYISPISPLCLPYISPISPLYLPYVTLLGLRCCTGGAALAGLAIWMATWLGLGLALGLGLGLGLG